MALSLLCGGSVVALSWLCVGSVVALSWLCGGSICHGSRPVFQNAHKEKDIPKDYQIYRLYTLVPVVLTI